ncbi:dephospho-CoA kinase [Cohnella soli]|uniref:Dephospho-CoA kinase n=1 Tax=Cohnella soli TaxID=425005 RepID=A0ABW0HW17_9BACL
MNIGLTGGIATGKSTVASMLKQRGALLIDLDIIAREIVEPGQPSLSAIVDRFGPSVIREDGSLDRKKLGSLVFANTNERKALEAILHPAIRQVMKNRMTDYERTSPDKLVVVDVPLLFESGLEHYFEKVMVVYVPRSLQLKRLVERDGFNSEDAGRRLDAQMDIEEKRRRADIVIDNGGERERTEEQVERFWREMRLE